MSQKRTIKLDLDTKNVIKKLDNIEKELDGVKKQVKDGTEEMGKLGDSTNLTANGMATLSGQISIVAVSLKALVIRSVYGAFDTFYSILQQNQRVLDATNTAFETMNIFTRAILSDMIDFTSKGIVKDFFKDFEKGVPVLKRTVESIFNMSSKLKGLKAGFQIFNNIFGFTDRIKDAKDLADQIVNLRNEVDLAEAQQRLLQFTYQKEAEIQRQIRDDIRKTPEERFKANEKLGQILQNQLAEEKKVVDKRLELAELLLSTDEENVQFQVNKTNVLADLADLQERITGQESEQKVNEATLEQEIFEQSKKGRESVITLRKTGIDIENDYGLALKKTTENVKKSSEDEIKFAKLTAEAKRNIVANSIGQISELIGQESAVGKALAVSQALINTYSAAAAALAPPPVGAGPIFGPIAAAGAVALGMKSVKDILSVQLPEGDMGMVSTPSEPSVNNATETDILPTPSLEGIGGAGLLPNLGAIPSVGIGMQPVQAFVVENEISDSQALQEELELQATL
tara:strand:- start:42 stop:1586 length:1545 start_codon:yes stop_codon:yes gene_type:complete